MSQREVICSQTSALNADEEPRTLILFMRGQARSRNRVHYRDDTADDRRTALCASTSNLKPVPAKQCA